MSEDDLFFDFNDEQKPKHKPERNKTGNRRSVSSDVIIREHAEGWQLCTICMGSVHPAGHRLLKGQPWPIERFIFDNKEEATDAAKALAEYLGTEYLNDPELH